VIGPALTWAGVAMTIVGVVGIVLERDVYRRVHYAGVLGSAAAPLVCVGVALEEGWQRTAGKALLIGAVLVFVNPFLSHAIARAAWLRDGRIE
jgi:monovalent cation/proton antiporter MnhG/PhaG subunit